MSKTLHIATVEGSRPAETGRVLHHLSRDRRLRVRFIRSRADLAAMHRADAVLLMGGADIQPALYGQRRHPRTFAVAQHRDRLEYAMAAAALEHGIPTLGICRGMQMLTAAGGGTLHQDWQVAKRKPHRDFHLVAPFGPLARVMPDEWVNSLHHQSVAKPPRGFGIAARADDGTIEAIYKPGFLGVQWHPEIMAMDDHRWHGLFQWWLDGLTPQAARRHAAPRKESTPHRRSARPRHQHGSGSSWLDRWYAAPKAE